MASTDLASRLLAERHLPDLVPEILRGHVVRVLAVERTELKIVERLADEVVRALVDGAETILHVEFQSRHERDLPQRLLAYHALLRQRHHPLPVRTLVVYLMHEPPATSLPTGIHPSPTDPQLAFTYDLYCPWQRELSIEDVRRVPAIAPLAVLTPGIQSEDLPAVEDALARAPLDPAPRRDLFALGFLLARRRFPDDLLYSWRRRTMTLLEALKESPGYEELMADIREVLERRATEKGMTEGRREATQGSITDLVAARLGACPDGLSARLSTLDADALRTLFRALVAAPDLEELRRLVG